MGFLEGCSPTTKKMKQPIDARRVASYPPILTHTDESAIGSPRVQSCGHNRVPSPPLTPILDGIDRALGFSPPIRAGALSLLEREHNLHPGELWAIAAMAWGVGA
jgi:hypothetical protein